MFADSRTYPKLAVSRVSELVDKADSQGLDVIAGDLQDEYNTSCRCSGGEERYLCEWCLGCE